MPTSSTTGTGLTPPESQSPDGNGLTPPTSQDATTADSGDATNAPSHADWSTDDYETALRKARDDAKKIRMDAKRLAELEAAENERAEAALSDKERYEKKIAALEAQVAKEQEASQARMVRAEVRSVAQSLGIKAELALRLIETAAISYNDDGDPTNIGDLLKAAMDEYGLVTSQQSAPNGAQPSSTVPQTGATNPPRGSQRTGANGVFGRDEFPRVTDSRLWKRSS